MRQKTNQIIEPTLAVRLLTYLLSSIAFFFSFHYFSNQEEPSSKISQFCQNILPNYSFGAYTVTFILIVINSVMIRSLNERFGIIRTHTFIPSLIYIILISAWAPLQSNYVAQISLLIIILCIHIILNTYNSKNGQESAFLSSFLISISIFIHYELLILIPIFWIIYSVLRSNSFKIFLASLLGFLVPWEIIFGYHFFVNDRLPNIPIDTSDISSWNIVNFTHPVMTIYFVILILFFLISAIQAHQLTRRDNIKIRRYHLVLKILFFTFCLLFIFKYNIDFLPIVYVFYATLVGYVLSLKNTLFNRIILYTLIASSLSILLFTIILNWVIIQT